MTPSFFPGLLRGHQFPAVVSRARNNRDMGQRYPFILLVLLFLPVGCHQAEPVPVKKGVPVVCVINYPLQYFTERIAGHVVDVRFPIPEGIDPAGVSPSRSALHAFQSADLVLCNGAGYARWLKYASLPESRLLETAAIFSDRFIQQDHRGSHVHGESGSHSHRDFAGTTWLDPGLALLQAGVILEAILELVPRERVSLYKRYAGLKADLLDLQEDLLMAGGELDGMPILTVRPVYQYLARAAGLETMCLHWEPREAPGAAQWEQLAGIMDDFPATAILWPEEPEAVVTDRLAGLGIRSILFDPCASVPAAGNYLSVMRGNITRLASLGLADTGEKD